MQSVNTSNFTYTQPPFRATNVTNPYGSMIPGPTVTQSNIPVTSAHYSLLQPVTIQTGTQPTYLSPQPRGSTATQSFQQIRQITNATSGPGQTYVQYPQNSIIQTSTLPKTQTYVQPRPMVTSTVVEVQRIAPPITSIPVNSVINTQQQIQTNIIQPVTQTPILQQQPIITTTQKQLPPQYQQTVKYQNYQQPLVQTAKTSNWDSYYNNNKLIPPPPVVEATKDTTCCSPLLLGLLGLLGLAGLITAIVLATKAKSNYGTAAPGPQTTPGIPGNQTSPIVIPSTIYPNYTVSVQTSIVNTTQSITPVLNNTPSTQYSYANPITVQPTTTTSPLAVTVTPDTTTVNTNNPTTQVNPVNPTTQVTPVNPTTQINPVNPTTQVNPVNPTTQVNPVNPTTPVTPVNPTTQVNPTTPVTSTDLTQSSPGIQPTVDPNPLPYAYNSINYYPPTTTTTPTTQTPSSITTPTSTYPATTTTPSSTYPATNTIIPSTAPSSVSSDYQFTYQPSHHLRHRISAH